MTRTRTGAGRRSGTAGASTPARRRYPVGRPIQARLVTLEKHLGLFSEDHRLSADSRFNHPVIVRGEAPVPGPMREVFAQELGVLERLGQSAKTCRSTEVAGHRVCCLSYFHYDGFKALVYVSQGETFVAAWKDEEVLQPDSPRELIAGVPEAELEDFLAQVPG